MSSTRAGIRVLVAVVGALLLLSACGGGSEKLTEKAIESAGGGKVDVDIDGSGQSVTLTDNGEQVQAGDHLDPPEWLPGDFPLPEDADINLVATSEESMLMSGTTSVSMADVGPAIKAWMLANGYEILSEESNSLRAGRGEDELLEVFVGIGTFNLEFSRQDLSFDRQAAAEEIVTDGQATLVIDGDTLEFVGKCHITGEDYRFDYTSSDGTIVVSSEIYAVVDPVQASAFVMRFDSDRISQYTLDSNRESGPGPQLSFDSTGFSISGTFADLAGGQPVEGSLTVACLG